MYRTSDAIFRRLAPSTTIADHLPCNNCSYDLIGLKSGERCPECGTPIRIRPQAFDDVMTQAPRHYLLGLARGAWVMVISAAGFGLLLPLGVFLLRSPGTLTPGVMVLLLLSAAGWGWGVVRVTEPRETGQPTNRDLKTEWQWLRRASRWTQWCWGLAGLVLLVCSLVMSRAAATAAPGAPVAASYPVAGLLLAAGGMLIGFVGLLPVAIFLSLLSDWAQDASLGMRLRLAPFMLLISLPLGALAVWLGFFMLGRWIPVFVLPLLAVVGGAFLVTFGFFAVPMFQFANLCSWAHSNVTSTLDRDKRLGARVAKRILDAQAKPEPAAPAPAPPSRTKGVAKPQGHYVAPSSAEAEYDIVPAAPDKPAAKTPPVAKRRPQSGGP